MKNTIIFLVFIFVAIAIGQDAGDIIWSHNYGGSDDDFASSIEQTSDSDFIIAGYSVSSDGDVEGNHGENDYWILKLSDGAGAISTDTYSSELLGVSSKPDQLNFALTPNPFNSGLAISFVLEHDSYVKIEIFDQIGNELQAVFEKESQAGEFTHSWDAYSFESGIYLVRVTAGNRTGTQKAVLIK